jgi:sirohydrochlorin ferrochelatase
MEAILYIFHGSRIKDAQEEARAFIQSCIAEIPVTIQEYCFLELANPTIEETFLKCIEKGADKIVAIPVLLLTAAHAKEDIPAELNRLKRRFPHVKLSYGKPIGVHQDIIEILIERMHETEQEFSSDSMVLLVGRGSSDPEVKIDLGRIGELLKERTGIKRVDTCFLAAANPSFEEAIGNCWGSSVNKIFIIPYLLFTGILMKKLEKITQTNQDNLSKEIVLCNHLGYHPMLKNILQQRVHEAINLE